MATNNALNITASGIVKYDGAGTFAADTVTQHAMLVGGSSNSITSQLLTNGQLMIGNTGNDPTAATLTAGTGISIANSAGAVTISGTGGGLTWADTSGSSTVSSNTGYFVTAAATPTLPASPSNGDVVAFVVLTGALCTITGNTGQKINLSGSQSASAGTAATSVAGNAIWLTYRSTGTTWWANSSVGSWTIT